MPQGSDRTGYVLLLLQVAPSFVLQFSFRVPADAQYFGLGFSYFDAGHAGASSTDALSSSRWDMASAMPSDVPHVSGSISYQSDTVWLRYRTVGDGAATEYIQQPRGTLYGSASALKGVWRTVRAEYRPGLLTFELDGEESVTLATPGLAPTSTWRVAIGAYTSGQSREETRVRSVCLLYTSPSPRD